MKITTALNHPGKWRYSFELRYLLILGMLLYTGLSLEAQQLQSSVLASSGATASIDGYTINWTAGQAITGEVSNSTGSINQGFQQTQLDISTSVTHVSDLTIELFPNPTTDFINVLWDSNWGATQVRLFNAMGQLVLTHEANENTHRIDVQELKDDWYFLELVNTDQVLFSARIIKISK